MLERERKKSWGKKRRKGFESKRKKRIIYHFISFYLPVFSLSLSIYIYIYIYRERESCIVRSVVRKIEMPKKEG